MRGHVHDIDNLNVTKAVHDDGGSLLRVQAQVLASRRDKVYDVTVCFKITASD